MEEINQAVFNHLSMDTQGALLITGHWGAGKTFYLKKELFPKIIEEEKLGYTPLMISLFGESDTQRISTKILQELANVKGGGFFKSNLIFEGIGKMSKAIPILKKYVDSKELINLISGGVFEILKANNIVLFFDDLERLGKGLLVDDFLGYVNELSENKGCKIVIVANEGEIDKTKQFSYKEKTISKTVLFAPDLIQIFNSIRDVYIDDAEYHEFLIKNESFFLRTLNPTSENLYDSFEKEYEQELSKSFANIRSLKSVLEHYKVVFGLIGKGKDVTNKVLKQKLLNVWSFCLAVIIETRKPDGLEYGKTKKIDELSQFEIFLDFALDTDGSKESKSPLEFQKKFKKMYFERLGVPYYYYPEVYSFLTAGKTIDLKEFETQLDYNFRAENNKVSPEYELYQQFMSLKRSQFSDEEFPEKLESLLKYVEEGLYHDFTEYVNMAVYIFGFREYFKTPKTVEEIILKFHKGIESVSEKFEYTAKWEVEREFLIENIQDKEVTDITNFIDAKVKAKKELAMAIEVKELEKELLSYPVSFASTFLKGKHKGILTPNDPIFKHFSSANIIERLKTWNAEGTLVFSSILEQRYLKGFQVDHFKEEFENIVAITDFIIGYQPKEKKYSNHYFEKTLLPKAVEVSERIKKLLE